MRRRRKTATLGFIFAAALAVVPVARAQMCTPDFCEVPIDGIETVREEGVAAVAHGYMDADEFASFLRRNAFGEDGGAGADDERGFAWRLLAAFVAGLLLNLSPCVLPLLPIQLAVLGMGASAGGKRRGAVRGTTYGLAMAATYGAVGFAIAKSGVFFGSLQSTRPYNAAMAALFAFLGLAALGVANIDFSGGRKRVTGPLPLAGVAAAGALAAIMAGACVAPAVLGTMLYAAGEYAAGNAPALALPLALGLGMAFPWPFIGAGLSVLPRPGKWMNMVKWLFAAVAFALAARYARLAMPARHAAGDGAVDASGFAEAYARAVSAGRPVVIDFFASWCASCSRMERTTFNDPDVAALLGRCEFLRARLEDPLAPESAEILARFGIRGFPAIVVILPGSGAAMAQPAPNNDQNP